MGGFNHVTLQIEISIESYGKQCLACLFASVSTSDESSYGTRQSVEAQQQQLSVSLQRIQHKMTATTRGSDAACCSQSLKIRNVV